VERQAIIHAYKLRQEKVVYVYHIIASRKMGEETYFHQVKKELLSEMLPLLERKLSMFTISLHYLKTKLMLDLF